jgi:hypothetical protein
MGEKLGEGRAVGAPDGGAGVGQFSGDQLGQRGLSSGANPSVFVIE